LAQNLGLLSLFEQAIEVQKATIENGLKSSYTGVASSKFTQRRKGYHHAQASACELFRSPLYAEKHR
jgi:hypothetical protein